MRKVANCFLSSLLTSASCKSISKVSFSVTTGSLFSMSVWTLTVCWGVCGADTIPSISSKYPTIVPISNSMGISFGLSILTWNLLSTTLAMVLAGRTFQMCPKDGLGSNNLGCWSEGWRVHSSTTDSCLGGMTVEVWTTASLYCPYWRGILIVLSKSPITCSLKSIVALCACMKSMPSNMSIPTLLIMVKSTVRSRFLTVKGILACPLVIWLPPTPWTQMESVSTSHIWSKCNISKSLSFTHDMAAPVSTKARIGYPFISILM